jgi:hypothetical protein
VRFLPAAPKVRRECQATADAVRYAVPCPTRLPTGLTATPAVGGCPAFEIVGWARTSRRCAVAVSWRGWIVGFSETSRQHLVVQGAPRVVRDPARAINGPGWYRGDRVEAHGVARIAGQTMRWYYVRPNLNEGSAFAHHLVVVWTESGHTYAYRFHVVTTLAETRALDLELVRHVSMVRPRRTP